MATLLLILAAYTAHAQRKLPDVTVSDIAGRAVATSTLLTAGQPVVISFWSTICKPCLEEMGAYRDNYEAWNGKFPFQLVAVSVDDNRFNAKVKAIAAAAKWPATVLLDKNQQFKRALNVNAIPQVFLFDQAGKLVYTHAGYTAGSELELFDALADSYRKPAQ